MEIRYLRAKNTNQSSRQVVVRFLGLTYNDFRVTLRALNTGEEALFASTSLSHRLRWFWCLSYCFRY